MSTLQFGAAVIYVDSGVQEILAFYGRAFGLATRFYDPTTDFGELETGGPSIAIAAHKAGEYMVGEKYTRTGDGNPANCELAFLTNDVAAAFAQAVEAGATPLSEPKIMPWGQTVAYVASIEGPLIGLMTPPNAM